MGKPCFTLSFMALLNFACRPRTSSRFGNNLSTNSRGMRPVSMRGLLNTESSTFNIATWDLYVEVC